MQVRLVDIAVREFGLKGLEGASTRGIAAAAGTAMSSITYHYGGKEGLYLAAADHIAATMAGEMAPALAAEQVITPDDSATARAAIDRILARFIDKMVSDVSADFALFIVREQMHPTEAFDRIYAGLIGQLMERLVALIRTATEVHDRKTAAIAAVTLMGQVMAVRASRASMLRLLDLPAPDETTIAALKARVRSNTDAILDAMIAERQEP